VTTAMSALVVTIAILNKCSIIVHLSTITMRIETIMLKRSQALTISHLEEAAITEDVALAQCPTSQSPQKMLNLGKATIKQKTNTTKTECEVAEVTI